VAGLARVLCLEHAEHETAGLLGDAVHVRRARLERCRLWKGERVPSFSTLDGAVDAVVALGGLMSAWDDAAHPFLAQEAHLLGEAARAGVATLGVCLGAQLLARGLGARVYTGPRPEMGLSPLTLTDEGRADKLFAPLDGKDVLHWHHDTFDLPAGAVRLASTASYPNQAFRFGRRAYGVQFHVECDLGMRRAWARLGEEELRVAGVSPASLAAKTTNALDERGRAFASAFFRLV
jgi:GMP synthase-like glutamine amidotransferase